MLGVEPLSFVVLSVKPTPEMARALEAEAREGLQREADRAIYERRNTAVEQERRIKESELATEVALEERRKSLIELRTANEKAEADARAYALEATLKPAQGVDWKTLLAFGAMNLSPDLLEALTRK